MDILSDNLEGTEVAFLKQKRRKQSKSETDEFGRSLSLLAWRPLDPTKLDIERREFCHDLLRAGDISWFLHPEQLKLLEWLEDKERSIAVVCISRQFGKTVMMLAYCLAFCIKHPKSTVMFLAPSKRQLEDFILGRMSMLFSFFPDDLLPHRTGLIWTFANGSVFRLDGVGAGRGARIRGNSADLVVVDECRDVINLQETIDSHVSPMLLTTEGKMILISTPPDSPLHAFTDKFIREAIRDDNFYTATYKQNPLITTRYLRKVIADRYKGGEANPTFRREFMADYTVTDEEKRVVREWDEGENDLYFETYKGAPDPVRIYVSMDYGFSDPCGLIAGYYDYEDGVLIVEEEWFERRKNTDEVGQQITDMEHRLRQRLKGSSREMTTRVMDLDPSMMSDLSARWDLRFEPAFKVPSALTMVNRLRIAISQGKIRIRPACVQLRFQLKAGVYNQKNTDYVRTERGGHLDLLSALVYLNLNLRWTEILNQQGPQPLKANEMWVGNSPFGRSQRGNFAGGIINRPI